ncbi:unnamed protein product [Prunus armeniaca]|uniref:At1g61320/AtMIF1 LRR domain-containing protein n=1 Tax=Prunus armeniaca TaxID=36596 RepID=A0A6J5WZ63_PRUAR|nr:unnamed protein product [Prunus armeniaca]
MYRGEKVDSFKAAFYLDAKSADTLNAWISFAILRGVEVLDLHLFQLATSSTLKHLRLSGCVLRPPPDFDGFMQLRTLYLERVTVDEVFMASMFSICLFLESLSLLGCSIDSSLIVDGPTLRLNDLKVLNCFNDPANIKISAVNLASFEYSGNIHHISSIKTPRLSRIYFNNHMVQNAFPHALTRLASFPQLVTLYLLLEDDLVKEQPESLPTFRNLKQLELVVHGPEKSSKDNELVWVLKFLKATPLLQELAIKARWGPQFYEGQPAIRNIDSGFLHD